MPVAKKKSDLKIIADQDEVEEIRLGKPFKKDINTFLRKINNDFAQQYIAEGTVVDAKDYKAELIAVLALNYRKISNAFKFNVRESFDEKTTIEMNAIINNSINKFTKELEDFKSDIILDTTNREISKELASSIQELIDDDKELTNIVIADLTRKNLNDKTQGRATNISMTETGTMAESAKDIEEKELIRNDVVLSGVILANVLKDIWITILDNLTRTAHALADGQEKSPFEKFFVGGEFLRYPKDPNGSIENIVNCRCKKVAKIF